MINDDVITILEDQRVLHFAKGQFKQLSGAAGAVHSFPRIVIGTYGQLLACSPELASAVEENLGSAKFSDEFVIHSNEETLYLIGMTPRAALYAVYHYFELQHGLHWIYPGQPPVLVKHRGHIENNVSLHVAPLVERRGIVVETIDDVPFIQALIDWLAKNKINELFFTFTLWDKIGPVIQEMIIDRGIELTLGGHSTSFFLKQLQSEVKADHPYTAKKQLDYTDNSWQEGLFQQIIHYCSQVGNLKRISLWPEDIKHQSSSQFLSNYIGFTERLQRALHDQGLPLEVEHIAYNAGLAWDMLELHNGENSSSVNTLFAYWGRDYSERLQQPVHDSDKRAYDALLDWREKTKHHATGLTIFEYYSDHFMLSPLFPMLADRIACDIKDYVSLGIEGITNLIVPCREDHYPYQWNQNYNNYVFARTLWNDPIESIKSNVAHYFPAENRLMVKALLAELEQVVASLTRWNVPFFPARAVDPLKSSNVSHEEVGLILEQLERIISLARYYLAKPEIQSSLQLHVTLLHYERYALQVKAQWLSLSN